MKREEIESLLLTALEDSCNECLSYDLSIDNDNYVEIVIRANSFIIGGLGIIYSTLDRECDTIVGMQCLINSEGNLEIHINFHK